MFKPVIDLWEEFYIACVRPVLEAGWYLYKRFFSGQEDLAAQACYSFERELARRSPQALSILEPFQTRDLIAQIARRYNIDVPDFDYDPYMITAPFGYLSSKHKIVTRDVYMRKINVLHEMAHAVALKGGYADKNALHHGPEFMGVLLQIYAEYLDIPWQRLRNMARAHNVQLDHLTEPASDDGLQAAPV